MARLTHHLQNAIIALDQVNTEVKQGARLSPGELELLASLTDQIAVVRNQMILCDLEYGLTGKEVAVKYGLSPSRISQIKRLALEN